MSNPIVQQRALASVTPQAPPATAPAGQVPATQLEPGFVDTPALLNRWQLIGMTTAIVFGLLSALVQFTGWQADGRAADDTEQLVRVQEIQSSLLSADALATNAFLVGGLENTQQRANYDRAIDNVLKKITEAARAQPADREVLDDLNIAVTDYATAVAQARANNRLGYPIGAEYLSGASAQLDDRALPILDQLVAANTSRAEGSMAGQHPLWLMLIGVVALGVLFWLNRELARAFRRRFNKGLTIAAAIVLAVTSIASIGAFVRDGSNDHLRDNEFAAAVALADTRTAANDAKATESLRLIKRGNGAVFEKDWQASVEEVEKGLARAGSAADWNLYKQRHQEIVDLDNAGDWNAARTLATGSGAEGATAPFTAFDEATTAEIEKNAALATDALRGGRVLALVFSVLTVLLGMAAAVAVARGIGERRREFS